MRSAGSSNLYMTSDYLPAPIAIAGIVIYSVIMLCCVAVGALAIFWGTIDGKLLFGLVLILIFVAALFRVRLVFVLFVFLLRGFF
jgi:hypothetical protein